MAATVIPEDSEGTNAAERAVIAALASQLPEDAVVLPNRHLTVRGQDREADVIVVLPEHGMVVIEVKGGNVDYYDGAFRTGSGRPIRPVEQAQDFKHDLFRWLRKHPRFSGQPVRGAHHVVLPNATLPPEFHATECARDAVSDATDMGKLGERLRAQLDAMAEPPPLSQARAQWLTEALVGPSVPQIDLAAQTRAALTASEAQCDLLTAQQFAILDTTREMRRIHISGGAGTGKTFLALKAAENAIREGKRVALLCYSKGLATWLQRHIEEFQRHVTPTPGGFVGTFHALGIHWGARDMDSQRLSPQDWEVSLPQEMARYVRQPTAKKFDTIIVDEAQDFGAVWWETAELALTDPDNGRLIICSDIGQRVFPRGTVPNAGFAYLRLDENLRNSRQIAAACADFEELPTTPRGPDGVAVKWVRSSPEMAVRNANHEVDLLLRNGYAPKDIMVLTTYAKHPTQRQRQAERDKKSYWHSFWGNEVFYSTVLGAKGLERPVVVLAVNGFRDREHARQCQYVGMSRARDLLVVCGQR